MTIATTVAQDPAASGETTVPSTPGQTTVPAEKAPNIVNILLIGLDRFEDGTTSSGTEYHADTMMLVAVNFDEQTADLISLPRDTLAHIPGVKGIYKLNASINVGGGIEAPEQKGFLKVCEAAEWMLGGIGVDYFVAVQFDSIINLVDGIGGVDYDVDIKTAKLNQGQQHLDGAQVLSYLRVRSGIVSGGELGDRGRVDRQKRMMVAVFNQLKNANMMKSIPTLFSAVSNVFTNISTEQALALANYGMNIDTEQIGQYSLYGPYKTVMQWNFTLVNQENRVAVIKDVYGIDVPPYTDGTFEYGVWLVEHGFTEWKYLAAADRVDEQVAKQLTDDEEDKAAYQAFQEAYRAVQAEYEIASVSLSEQDTAAMETAMAELKARVLELADRFACPEKPQWTVAPFWWTDPDINEIHVDFR